MLQRFSRIFSQICAMAVVCLAGLQAIVSTLEKTQLLTSSYRSRARTINRSVMDYSSVVGIITMAE